MLKKTRKLVISCLFLFVLVGPLFGMVPLIVNSPQIHPIDASPLQSQYIVSYEEDLTALSNTINSLTDVGFDPQENIVGVGFQNFTLLNGLRFQVFQKDPYLLEFTMTNVTLTGDWTINGSPTIAADTVNITQTFESLNYGIGNRIESPNLALNNVNATVIRFRVSGGTFSWNNSKTTALTLNGFDNAILQSSIITGDLIVIGAGNVTILDTTYGNLIEDVNPIIVPEQSTYSVPYAFVFQSNAKVEIKWAGYDNIQGPAFDLQYNLTIYKNEQYVETLINVTTTSRQITIDTAAAFYEIQISCKDQQGNSATATITIVPDPNLLWFILMIVLIAAGAIAGILILYWRKQHQWQKTALVEIPAT